MIYKARNLERVAKNISEKVQDELDRVGIFHRTFYRCKNEDSIELKLAQKNYNGVDTFLRDIIGLRTNLYFVDDIDIVYPYFKTFFDFVEETRDINVETEFKPTRLNLIFKVLQEFDKEFKDLVSDKRIDNTFEFQFRTVLSEGWHEVDHDLRYKCKPDWNNNQDLGRMFNGVLASLEASDWTTIQIFQNLTYRHYKNNNIESMVRSKYRIRLAKGNLDPELNLIISSNEELKRALYKIDRTDFLSKFLKGKVIMPININNLIYYLNYLFINDQRLNEVTPSSLHSEFVDND